MENNATPLQIEELEPQIKAHIEGAEKAVQYFQSMINANDAINQLIKTQLDYAQTQLNTLKDEYQKKFG